MQDVNYTQEKWIVGHTYRDNEAKGCSQEELPANAVKAGFQIKLWVNKRIDIFWIKLLLVDINQQITSTST